MKTYERREAGAETYYKLATYDPRSLTFRDGKAGYPTEAAARAAARKAGTYRVSKVGVAGRADLDAFDVR